MYNINKLLDKCEAMTLLCTRACTHWSLIKFCFNIPLVLTSSAMCIINSISTDTDKMKIPNIVVNGLSVLIISLNNSIKSNEKFELFKKLSQSFMSLAQELESLETDITKQEYDIFNLKYENLITETMFEEIPLKYKKEVSFLFTENNRHVPIQINGTIGNLILKRNSKDISITNNNV